MTGSGWLIVRDGLTVGDWRQENDFEPHRRPPPDDEAEHLLVRQVECVQGEVDVEMICQPAFDYGATRLEWQRRGDDGHRRGGQPREHRPDPHRRPAARRRRHRRARPTPHEDGRGPLQRPQLGAGAAAPDSAEDCEQRLQRTIDFWRRWLEGGNFPDHPWRDYLQRSALVLKGLTYNPTGALIAALTTSLPETPGGERNWDYRYTWIRDSTFTLWALHTLGLDYEATDFMGWMTDVYKERVKDGMPGLQIMYGIGGEKNLTETTLDHLSGYEGARPVRTGNAAYDQRQNDVYGALLDSVYIHAKVQDHLPHELWEALCRQVETAITVWPEPDQGIWEARGDPKHYISSQAHVLGGRRPRLPPRRPDRRRGPARALDQGGGGDPRRHPRARDLGARRLPPALRDRRPRRLHPAGPARPVPAARRRAGDQHRQGDPRRAHRERPGAALPGRRDRRRPRGRGGELPDLLLLARLGPLRDRRAPTGARDVREAPRDRRSPRPLRRGAGRQRPAATGATSPRPSPTSP